MSVSTDQSAESAAAISLPAEMPLGKMPNYDPLRYLIPTTIGSAATYGDIDALKAELKSGVHPDEEIVFRNMGIHRESEDDPVVRDRRSGYPALFYALKQNQVEAVRVLLKAKADVNASYPYDTSPIFYASSYDAVVLLRQFGADINARANGLLPVVNALEDTLSALPGFFVSVQARDGLVPAVDVEQIVQTSNGRRPMISALLDRLQEVKQDITGQFKEYKWQGVGIAALVTSLILAERQLAEKYPGTNAASVLLNAAKAKQHHAVAALLKPVDFRGRTIRANILAKEDDGTDILIILNKNKEEAEAYLESVRRTSPQLLGDKSKKQDLIEEAKKEIQLISDCIESARTIAEQASSNDIFAYLWLFMHEHNLNRRDMAMAMGVFEGYVEAIENRLIVPDKKALQRLCTSFHITKGSFEYTQIMQSAAIERGKHRKESFKLGGQHRVNLIRALSAVDIDTPLAMFPRTLLRRAEECHAGYFSFDMVAENSGTLTKEQVIDKLKADRNSWSNKGRKLTVHDATGIAPPIVQALAVGTAITVTNNDEIALRSFVERTILDIWHDRIVRKPVTQIVDDYFIFARERAVKNVEAEVNLHDFVCFWADSWRIPNSTLSEELGFSRNALFYGRNTQSLERIRDEVLGKLYSAIEKVEGEAPSVEVRRKIHAIRYGNILMGDSKSLGRHALAILASEPALIKDHTGNPVLEYMMNKMPGQIQIIETGVIDKSLVPTALMAVLMECTGHSFESFVKSAGFNLDVRGDRGIGGARRTLSGESAFTVYVSGENKGQLIAKRCDYPARAANFFADDQATRNELTAAFLAHPKFYGPDELVEMYLAKTIHIGQVLTILRTQEGAGFNDWAKIVNPETPYNSTVQKIEQGRYITTEGVAERITEHVYKMHPQDHGKNDFLLALKGKLSAITPAMIEAEIERSFCRVVGEDTRTAYAELDRRATPFELPVEAQMVVGPQRDTVLQEVSAVESKPKTALEIFRMMVEVGCGKFHGCVGTFLSSAKFVDSSGQETCIKNNFINLLSANGRTRMNTDNTLSAMAAAKKAGLKPNAQRKFALICASKIMEYDPSIIDRLIDGGVQPQDMTIAERQSLLLQLRNNAHLSCIDVWVVTPRTTVYDTIEQNGFIRETDPARMSKVQDILEAFIPSSFDDHRQFLQRMLLSQCKDGNATGAATMLR